MARSVVLRSSGLVLACSAAMVAALAAPASAAPPDNPLRGVAKRQAADHAASYARAHGLRQSISGSAAGRAEDDPLEEADQAEEYAGERLANGQQPYVGGAAANLLQARTYAAKLAAVRASVREVTRQPYNAEPPGYTDPVWSNQGSGFRQVSGRVTALATDRSTIYAGAAGGGVWRTTNGGRTWRSIWDRANTLSIGALLVTRDHALWVGTGEANTNADSYLGTGVYRVTNGGRTVRRVGGDQLVDHTVYRLRDDGYGHVYAATNDGLYRHSSTTTAGAWTRVLLPNSPDTGNPYTNHITDVVVRPRTHGQTVLAVAGWRNGDTFNGFYLSSTGGGAGSYSKITPTGAVDATDIGRTTLAYAADGSRLYALIESPRLLSAGGDTNLQGVYVSASGNPAGPYTLIADSAKLGASGSALQKLAGYHVGVQSWYNQALLVDPANPRHVYVSLEEVFETRDGGTTFTTASPYWNYGLACGTACPPTTHPDQHALALTSGRQIVIGNDGGVYRRPVSVTGYGHWANLNATLHTLQYYDGDAGRSGRGYGYWGGLQDNGTSFLRPGAKENVEPAGGDGGFVLVDPKNADRSVGEYVNLEMYKTSDGGHTFTTISPECDNYTGADCDPSARFIAPFERDPHNVDHWVAAGTKVWDTTKGWDTTCAGANCDWKPQYTFPGGSVGTALGTSGTVTYAAWVAGGGNPGPSFGVGISTNYGGAWHEISMNALPQRYIAGLRIDPSNPAHVYAVFNGYSRRWIPGATGTVFETRDGGAHWKNLSGNLPNAPGDGLVVVRGRLVLATDIGLFTATTRNPTRWSRVPGVPNAVVDNVRVVPGTNSVLAATHGRGLWQVTIR